MNTRVIALTGALALALSACPPPGQNPDGGSDAGPDGEPIGTCSAPCGPNQVCDAEQHICVDGCRGTCVVGQICVNRAGTPACESIATTCGGSACGAGQISCVAGSCSCLPLTMAMRDACADEGRVCHQAYNPVTDGGGACEDPRLYEFCGFSCPTASCPSHCAVGQRCADVFGVGSSMCVRACATQPCGVDELCSGGTCLPYGAYLDLGCKNTLNLPDGGTVLAESLAGDLCFRLDQNGVPAEATPTGTCSWAFFSTDTQAFPIAYCRTPGPVAKFGACKTDPLPMAVSNTCSTGLECVPVGRGDDGLCLSACNAAEPGCPSGESCANFYRFSDDRVVLGACMASCNVFSTQANFGCVTYGARETSCVPTPASGAVRVSANGDGICAPQLASPKSEGEACAETDAFRGAACQSGLLCAQISGEAQPRCVKACDLECVGGTDAGVPARCATEANATCATGRTCTRTTGTTGTIVGFCL
jgi:hypothetical protein